MNYFFLTYPILSVLSFLMISQFPTGILIFLFMSGVTLLWYGEDLSRNRSSDLIFAAIVGFAVFVNPFYVVGYLAFILIPVSALIYVRKGNFPSFFAICLGPLPVFLIFLSLVLFSDSFVEGLREYISTEIASIDKNLKASFTVDERVSQSFYVNLFSNKDNLANLIIFLIPPGIYGMLMCFVYMLDKAKPVISGDNKIVYRDFRLPDFFVWFLILGGFLILFKNPYLKNISYSVLIIFGVLYFLQGLQLMGIFFDRVGLSRFIRMLFYLFVVITNFAVILLTLFGLFSIWFRPKWTLRPTQAEGNSNGGK